MLHTPAEIMQQERKTQAMPPHDRCKSAPDIRSSEHHRHLELMCAAELRRISDEFHHSYCVSMPVYHYNLLIDNLYTITY